MIGLRPIPGFGSVHPGSPVADQGAHPSRVSGVGTQATGVCIHLGALDLCAQAAGSLSRVCVHPGYQVWVPRLLIIVRAHLGFQVWAPSPLVWVSANWASGVCWGCLSVTHSPGAEGVGAQEATVAGKSSLNSSCVPLFSRFQEIPPIQPPVVQTSTWPLTQPSLALSLESCSRPCALDGGFSCPSPRAGPRDLVVLKQSSYHLIFQCPLSLVSDLHICWNTVGCSLCSSDQLGVSLVPRGHGPCSHLSCHHLPEISKSHLLPKPNKAAPLGPWL